MASVIDAKTVPHLILSIIVIRKSQGCVNNFYLVASEDLVCKDIAWV